LSGAYRARGPGARGAAFDGDEPSGGDGGAAPPDNLARFGARELLEELCLARKCVYGGSFCVCVGK